MAFPRTRNTTLLVVIAALTLASVCVLPQSKPKLPKEKQLDRDVRFTRDPVSGEVKAVAPRAEARGADTDTPATSSSAIRSEVRLVQAACSAVDAEGNSLRGLAEIDFRVAADSVPQKIVHFDASTEPAQIALLLDASPSEFHALGTMRDAARALSAQLSPQDQVAVIAFAGHTHLLLPFSTNRTLLADALDKVQVMRELNEIGSTIYGSVFLVSRELFSGTHSSAGRKAVILLSDGQDTSLRLNWDPKSMEAAPGANYLTFEDVIRELAGSGVEVFAISTENRPKGMTSGWIAAHQGTTLISADSRRIEIPPYTAFLAELVRRAGGEFYFLREAGTLSDVYARIAAELRTQYTLGFYPDGNVAAPGWHTLRFAFSQPQSHPGAQLNCRPSYYVPAAH